jgi:hypothetical protein
MDSIPLLAASKLRNSDGPFSGRKRRTARRTLERDPCRRVGRAASRTYLRVRLLVIRGFLNTYADTSVPAQLQNLVSNYMTNQELGQMRAVRFYDNTISILERGTESSAARRGSPKAISGNGDNHECSGKAARRVPASEVGSQSAAVERGPGVGCYD